MRTGMSQSSPTCGSCGQPVRWVRTVAGAMMPLDDEPSPTGNVVPASTPAGPRARVLAGGEQPPTGVRRYTSHMDTCPHTNQHRRRGAPEPNPDQAELF